MTHCNPGNKVWSYCADMGIGSGLDSYVVKDFQPAATDVSVKAG